METDERSPILDNDQNNENGETNEDTDEVEEEESWYGWLVVAASFLCNMVIDGMGYSFGKI